MSRKERERLVMFDRVKAGESSRREAAEVLGISLRQLHRQYVRYRVEGHGGLVHRGRGRASSRRIGLAERERALVLYRERYRSFGPTLWAEKLELHGIWVSHDTATRWLKSEGLMEHGRVLQLNDSGQLKKVEVWERTDGSLEVLGDGRRLSWTEIDQATRKKHADDQKRAARGPVKNNKRHKPTKRQQLVLTPRLKPIEPGHELRKTG